MDDLLFAFTNPSTGQALILDRGTPQTIVNTSRKPFSSQNNSTSDHLDRPKTVYEYLATEFDGHAPVEAEQHQDDDHVTSHTISTRVGRETETTDFGYIHTRRFGHRSHYPSRAEASSESIIMPALPHASTAIPSVDGITEHGDTSPEGTSNTAAPSSSDDEKSSASYSNNQPSTSEASTGNQMASCTNTSRTLNGTTSLLPRDSSGADATTSPQPVKFEALLKTMHDHDTDRDNEFKRLYTEIAQLRNLNRDLQLENTQLCDDKSKLQASITDINKATFDEGTEVEVQAAERKVLELRQAMAKQPFVFVLIDGEAFRFQDVLVHDRMEGGARAAAYLEEIVKNHLSESLGNQVPTINARIYVDFARIVGTVGRYQSEAALAARDFVNGFNCASPGFDMIDSGSCHEKTVEKIAALLELNALNCHCKHLILGCARQPRYLQILSKLSKEPFLNLTLIDGDQHNALGPHETLHFDVMQMDHIFEYTSMNGNKSRSPNRAENDSLVPLPYADPSTPEMPRSLAKAKSSWSYELGKIYTNIDDQRIDPPLPPYSKEAMKIMTSLNNDRHFCRFHHLLGFCSVSGCEYRHGRPLNDQEISVLRLWNRRIRCIRGLKCRDRNCVLGHNCPYGADCLTKNCIFSHTHGMDKNVVKVLRN